MFTPKALLIDMDDTLFRERDYVESGFQAVASFLEAERDLPSDYSFPSMIAFLELEGRGKVFDRIIERFEIRRTEGLVAACIDMYRNHAPQIELYSGVRNSLAALANDYALALVSNGLPVMQQHKLDALGVADFFDAVVFCDGIGSPKPSPIGIQSALEDIGVAATEAVMIGDNPETDGQAAAAAGVSFIRVRSDRFAHLDSDCPEVAQFTDVMSLLLKLADQGTAR